MARKSYQKYLVQRGLPRTGFLSDPQLPTGMAFIEVDRKGENRILVFPGANTSLLPGDLRRHPRIWQGIKVFVTQLETPLSTVGAGLQMAKKRNALTLLNPSPAQVLPADLLSRVDYLVPNEGEAESLSGVKMKSERDLPRMADRLLARGVQNVVITLGPKGLYFKNRKEEIRMTAFQVKVLDTTAAGDAFMGALASGLAENQPLPEILRWANGAGALACTKLGAQPSLPQKSELIRFLRKQSASRGKPVSGSAFRVGGGKKLRYRGKSETGRCF
ncbi:MAG: ribokinase [Deltaproteobacteria bacterium]|nr:ribokinase [Deltaproteobacteria bacterium]